MSIATYLITSFPSSTRRHWRIWCRKASADKSRCSVCSTVARPRRRVLHPQWCSFFFALLRKCGPLFSGHLMDVSRAALSRSFVYWDRKAYKWIVMPRRPIWMMDLFVVLVCSISLGCIQKETAGSNGLLWRFPIRLLFIQFWCVCERLERPFSEKRVVAF